MRGVRTPRPPASPDVDVEVDDEDEDEDEASPFFAGGEEDEEGQQQQSLLPKSSASLSSASSSISFARGLARTLYGKGLPKEHAPRVAWLSLTLAVIIGGFWLLDSLKDTVLERTLGMEMQPKAKLLSVWVTLSAVVAYSRLLDKMNRAALFYCVGGSFAAVLFGAGLFLGSASHGMSSDTTSLALKVAGAVSYVTIEAYGSVAVGLFWSFVNSSVGLEEAESSYGLIIAGAQIGAILGSSLATLAGRVRVSTLFLLGSASPLVMAFLIWCYERLFEGGDREREGEISQSHSYRGREEHKEEREEDDTARWHRNLSMGSSRRRGIPDEGERTFISTIRDGYRLVRNYPYVTTLLGVSCLYEVVLTVLDYEMKVIGVLRFRSIDGSSAEADNEFATLMGHFGQITNSIALLMSLLGTSYVVRSLGLSTSLLIFPSLVLLAVVVAYAWPHLWVLFISVSILKALTYSFGEPLKEMLYMVTTDTIKYEAKAWVDMFGSRCAKGVGSLVTGIAMGRPEFLSTYGSGIIFFVSVALLTLSISIGTQFDELVCSGELIGPREGISAEEEGERSRCLVDLDWQGEAGGHDAQGKAKRAPRSISLEMRNLPTIFQDDAAAAAAAAASSQL